MQIDENQIATLISRPSEGLNIEIKNWFDPREPDGIRMFVKAAFAIRNQNGGFIVIGFDDKKLTPLHYNLSDAVETVYHADVLQGLISKYAFEAFEISVTLRDREGQDHPIVVIPDGVRVPAIVKATLKGDGGKLLLSDGDIYFRTLNANGTASSAKALPCDFPDLLEICFENREADIGRFLRRHLGSGDIAKFVEALSALPTPLPSPSLRDRAFTVIDEGKLAFSRALEARTLSLQETAATSGLTMHVGLALEPENSNALPTSTFMNSAGASNPQYTGWPVWLDSRGFRHQEDRANVIENAWQALIVDVNGSWSQHFEFMRLDPKGRFYLRRAMQDDLTPDKVDPGAALDTILMLYRVTEVLAVGINIARATGWGAEDNAAFAFRWTGLNGRQLSSWANPLRGFGSSEKSSTNEADGFTSVPLDTPHASLAPYVREATGPMFASFRGFEPSVELIEDCVRRLVERKMS